MRTALIAATAFAIITTTAAAPARADVAAAEALFKEGMDLMEAGNYKAACPKLEESQRLDPGVGTLYNLARCYEKTNRLASAWSRYLEASQEAERRDEPRRAEAARRHAKRLEPDLYRLVILVPKNSRVDGLAVERGGVAVGEGAWGARVPVDEGDVVVSASAEGYESWATTIQIGGDKKMRIVEIPRLTRAPDVPEPDGGLVIETVPGEPWYRDTVGWGVLGGGVALIGGGVFATLRAGSLSDDANAEPDLGERDRLFDQADTNRTAGAILLGVGAAAAVVGAVRLALAPADRERQVPREQALVIGPGSIAIKLRF